MSDARGDTALDNATVESYRSLGKLVVAVHQGGPISVQRLRVADRPLNPSN
jgi:hypothetical protein